MTKPQLQPCSLSYLFHRIPLITCIIFLPYKTQHLGEDQISRISNPAWVQLLYLFYWVLHYLNKSQIFWNQNWTLLNRRDNAVVFTICLWRDFMPPNPRQWDRESYSPSISENITESTGMFPSRHKPLVTHGKPSFTQVREDHSIYSPCPGGEVFLIFPTVSSSSNISLYLML